MKPIRELITGHPVLSLLSTATALEAARAMTTNRVGCVMIADRENRPQGIFTERDLMTRVVVLGKDPNRVRLEDVMSKEVFVVSPDYSLNEARLEMRKRHIRHLPIVEDGKVICVLSLRDLLRADLKDHEQDLEAMNAYINGEVEGAPAPPPQGD